MDDCAEISYLLLYYTIIAIIDYCVEAGIEGYNCVIERRCIPQEHFCDGVPDCGLDVIDERLGCTGEYSHDNSVALYLANNYHACPTHR